MILRRCHAAHVVRVSYRAVQREGAARDRVGAGKPGDALANLNREFAEIVRSVGHTRGRHRVGDERDPVRAFEMWNQDLVAKGGKIPTIEGWVEEMRKLGISAPLDPFLNNAATVLVVAPIAATLAQQLGYRPDPFLMAVAVGAACDFLTPIGHQCNTLVMGPGGYKFSDYPRLGLPLSLLVLVIGPPTILLFWPM